MGDSQMLLLPVWNPLRIQAEREMKESVRAALAVLKTNYGRVGLILADALPTFSYAVVGVVAQYAAFGTAKPDVKPQKLSTIRLNSTMFHRQIGAPSIHCMARAQDGKIWLGSDHGTHIFDERGNFVRHAASGQYYRASRGIGFAGNGDVLLSTHEAKHVTICNHDGSFSRTYKPRQFPDFSPWGITVPENTTIAETTIAVCDYASNVVVVLDLLGLLVAVCGQDQLHKPMAIAQSPSGEFFVSCEHSDKLHVSSNTPAD